MLTRAPARSAASWRRACWRWARRCRPRRAAPPAPAPAPAATRTRTAASACRCRPASARAAAAPRRAPPRPPRPRAWAPDAPRAAYIKYKVSPGPPVGGQGARWAGRARVRPRPVGFKKAGRGCHSRVYHPRGRRAAPAAPPPRHVSLLLRMRRALHGRRFYPLPRTEGGGGPRHFARCVAPRPSHHCRIAAPRRARSRSCFARARSRPLTAGRVGTRGPGDGAPAHLTTALHPPSSRTRSAARPRQPGSVGSRAARARAAALPAHMHCCGLRGPTHFSLPRRVLRVFSMPPPRILIPLHAGAPRQRNAVYQGIHCSQAGRGGPADACASARPSPPRCTPCPKPAAARRRSPQPVRDPCAAAARAAGLCFTRRARLRCEPRPRAGGAPRSGAAAWSLRLELAL